MSRATWFAASTRLDWCPGWLSFWWRGARRIWRRLAVLVFIPRDQTGVVAPHFTQPEPGAMDQFFERVRARARVGVHEDPIAPGPDRREEPTGALHGDLEQPAHHQNREAVAQRVRPRGKVEEVAPDEVLRGPGKQFPRVVEGLVIQVDPVRSQAVAVATDLLQQRAVAATKIQYVPREPRHGFGSNVDDRPMQNVHPVPREEAVVAMAPLGPRRDGLEGVVEAASEPQRAGNRRPRPRPEGEAQAGGRLLREGAARPAHHVSPCGG